MEEKSTCNVDNIKLLSHDDCLEIVYKDLEHKDFIPHKYELVKCSADFVGFMGEYHKLKVEIQENNDHENRTLIYFVKCLPLENHAYRDECERKGFFRKESSIYRDILPNIQRYADTPLYAKSYLARPDVIVLEDLSQPAKRLKHMDEGEQYTTYHYHLFLRHLAKLHAASLAWESNEDINIGEKFKDVLFEIQLTTNNEWYTTAVKGVLHTAQTHPKYQYAEAQEFIQQKLKNILFNMEEFASTSSTLRNVFCHRDSWDRNIFWEYDNNSKTSDPIACRIVDFQLTRYSPPAIDVLFFLYNNFSSARQRDEQLPGLLNFYYDSLRMELNRLHLSEDLISKAEFDENCRSALLPVITLQTICAPILNLPMEWANMMRATQPDVFDRYQNSDRREMFKEVAQIDPEYEKKIQAPVQELMEYFGFKAQ